MFKKADYIIIAITCIFLGIFIVSQYYTSKKVKQLVQPENNEILAIEVARYTTANAALRLEVQNLTHDLDLYKNSSLTSAEAYAKYQNDVARFDAINGVTASTGQGVTINIIGPLSTPKVVDLINAIKNIGGEQISINDTRISLNTDLSVFAARDQYWIKVLGNSKLMKSAIERKGGILEQISDKNLKISVVESDRLELPAGLPINFQYAKILE